MADPRICLTACVTQATIGVEPDLGTALFRVLRALRRHTAGEPVDGPALLVLHQIGCAGPVRLSDLAATLGLDASTVSRHVRGLEESGYVTRAGDPGDRRAALLAPTPTGRATLDDATARRKALLDAALAAWAPQDRAALSHLLGRLADDLAGPRRAPAAPSPHAIPETP